MASNLPPGGGFFRDGEELEFAHGPMGPDRHIWEVPGFFELGGFFVDPMAEDYAHICPACGAYAEETAVLESELLPNEARAAAVADFYVGAVASKTHVHVAILERERAYAEWDAACPGL